MIYSFIPPPLNNRYYVRIDAHEEEREEEEMVAQKKENTSETDMHHTRWFYIYTHLICFGLIVLKKKVQE